MSSMHVLLQVTCFLDFHHHGICTKSCKHQELKTAVSCVQYWSELHAAYAYSFVVQYLTSKVVTALPTPALAP